MKNIINNVRRPLLWAELALCLIFLLIISAFSSGLVKNAAEHAQYKPEVIQVIDFASVPTVKDLRISPALVRQSEPEVVPAEPQELVPNVSEAYPGLCIAPDTGAASYVVGSPVLGVVTGNDSNRWERQTLHGARGVGVNCAYDDAGNMHTVWVSAREETGYFNVMYNKSNSAGTPGQTRNMAEQLFGNNRVTLHNPYIGYSNQQHKLFLYFTVRSEPSWPVMISISGDQGETWSKPEQIGAQEGYRPAEPFMVMDGDGNPHIFYGVFVQNGDTASGRIIHRMRQSNGGWTAPDVLAQGRQRPILTKARVAPNGDIYVTWTDGPMDLARWSRADGKWTVYQNVSGDNKSSHPAIAIGNDETVRIFWYRPEADIYGLIISRVSYDGGASWQPPRLIANTRASKIGRFYGLQALGGAEKVYLLISADKVIQSDGTGIPTLFLHWTAENAPPPLIRG